MSRRRKIEACLALAERSPFPAEREAARGRAEVLLASEPPAETAPAPAHAPESGRRYRSGVSGGMRRRVLAAVEQHFAHTGRSPTLREIAAVVGFHSSHVEAAVRHLVHDGLLEHEPRVWRGIRLPGSARAAVAILLPGPAQ